MSRAQERGSGLQSGAQGAEKVTGATGTGPASGAGASGSTGSTTTGTTLRDRERTTTMAPQTSYARGTKPATSYDTGASSGISSKHMLGGVLATLAGLLTFFAGLGAVVRRAFYPALNNYAYHRPVRSWGWILLVLGVLLFAAGASHLLGITYARAAAVGLAVLTAIAAFLFLPYAPVWSIVLVALSVAAIVALLNRSRDSGSSGSSGSMGGTSSGMSAGSGTTFDSGTGGRGKL
jgi:hypothetical protein